MEFELKIHHMKLFLLRSSSEAQDILAGLIERLPEFLNCCDEEHIIPPPFERTRQQEVDDAIEWRKFVNDRLKDKVCACCSLIKGRDEVTTMPMSQFPHLELLRTDLPSTKEMPRHGKTFYEYQGVKYCLQGYSNCDEFETHPVRMEEEELVVDLCSECLRSLKANKVPPNSLVIMDIGPVPRCPETREMILPPLFMFEAILLAEIRISRLAFICHPVKEYPMPKDDPKGNRGCWRFKGHVIAHTNPSIQELRQCFPMHPDEIPEFMQAVFITQTVAKQNISALMKSCQFLRCRPKVLIKHIEWRLQVR